MPEDPLEDLHHPEGVDEHCVLERVLVEPGHVLLLNQLLQRLPEVLEHARLVQEGRCDTHLVPVQLSLLHHPPVVPQVDRGAVLLCPPRHRLLQLQETLWDPFFPPQQPLGYPADSGPQLRNPIPLQRTHSHALSLVEHVEREDRVNFMPGHQVHLLLHAAPHHLALLLHLLSRHKVHVGGHQEDVGPGHSSLDRSQPQGDACLKLLLHPLPLLFALPRGLLPYIPDQEVERSPDEEVEVRLGVDRLSSEIHHVQRQSVLLLLQVPSVHVDPNGAALVYVNALCSAVCRHQGMQETGLACLSVADQDQMHLLVLHAALLHPLQILEHSLPSLVCDLWRRQAQRGADVADDCLEQGILVQVVDGEAEEGRVAGHVQHPHWYLQVCGPAGKASQSEVPGDDSLDAAGVEGEVEDACAAVVAPGQVTCFQLLLDPPPPFLLVLQPEEVVGAENVEASEEREGNLVRMLAALLYELEVAIDVSCPARKLLLEVANEVQAPLARRTHRLSPPALRELVAVADATLGG
eukprot:357750-Hanusia_phi.AAC.3